MLQEKPAIETQKPVKLAILTTHPIQYYAPVFKLMAKKIKLKVFYTKKIDSHAKYDKGFRQKIEWDIPLLEGYDYEYISSHHTVQELKQYQPTQLLVYGWAHPSHIWAMHYFKGIIPVIFRGDSILLNKSPIWKNYLKTLVLKWIYKNIDKVVYVGTHNKAYFKAFGLKEEQLFFAPHSIDNKRFSEKTKFSNLISKESLGIPETDLLLLFAGKFDDNKNPFLLLQAFTELASPNTHLLFAGSGILEQSLKAKCKKHKNIHVLPFQNQTVMPSLYQACDLFCLPSLGDSWGLVINEAMAAGKAVLASDKVGSAIDLIQPENGKIFRSGDLEDLKHNLKKLTVSRRQLIKSGKLSSKIIQNWSLEIQVDNILKCLYTN